MSVTLFANHVFSTFRQSRDILHYFRYTSILWHFKYISPTFVFQLMFPHISKSHIIIILCIFSLFSRLFIIIMTYYDIYPMSVIIAYFSKHFNIYLIHTPIPYTTNPFLYFTESANSIFHYFKQLWAHFVTLKRLCVTLQYCMTCPHI